MAMCTQLRHLIRNSDSGAICSGSPVSGVTNHVPVCYRPRTELSNPAVRTLQAHPLLHSGRETRPTARMEAVNGAQATEDYNQLESFANQLADIAASVTTPYFRSSMVIDSKADESPVTKADREAEAAMRAAIHDQFPSHVVFGEEEGMTGDKSSRFMWVLDPIDGTKSFITGKPLYGTLIALLHDGIPVLGIIDQPILKERWVGISGQSTKLNGNAISTRKCGSVEAAFLYATSPHMFEGATEAAFARVRDAARMPLYGGDCYAYGLLAAGCVDLVVEADMKPYDFLALVPIVEGAGGKITNWRGASLRWTETPSHAYALDVLDGEVLAAGDPVVHEQALQLLAWDGY